MKLKILPLLLVCTMALTACGVGDNYRALETLRPVRTLGYDSADGLVTLAASTGKPGESGKILRLRNSGGQLPGTLDGLREMADQGELFFFHTQYLLLGQEAAASGIGPLLDFSLRDAQLRLGAELFLLRDGSAGDVVMHSGDASHDVTDLLDTVKRETALHCVSQVFSLRETSVHLNEYGAALVCLVEASADEAGSISLSPVGYGILRDGALQGVLEQGQAEAVSLLLGSGGTALRETGGVTLRVEGAGSEIEPSWNPDGSPGQTLLRLRVNGTVAETETGTVPDAASLSAFLQTSLEADLRGAVARSQALNADFLALGDALRRSGGDRFLALEQDWLPGLALQVAVEASIVRGSDMDEQNSQTGRKGGG